MSDLVVGEEGRRPLSRLVDDHTGPLPASEPESAFYWEALAEHRLVLLRCTSCSRFVHYPLACCPACHSFDLAPQEVSGHGTLYSFTDVHVRFVEGIEPPYVVALVELPEQEGLRVLGNLVDVDIADVAIGMPVRPVFADVRDGVTLLHFTKDDRG